MRESIRESILDTVFDLHKSGIVDDVTKSEIESLCLPEIKNYSPSAIGGLRKKLELSQAAFAHFLNISPATVQKWESGISAPSGAYLKLLDLAARRGLAGIT
jgi:putative transcriptional regulator